MITDPELEAIVTGVALGLRDKDLEVDAKLAAQGAQLAALEARPPARDGRDGVPGPPGRDGAPGPPGRDGVDGKDGLGFDDFEEVYDGERTLIHRYTSGGRVKEFRHRLRLELYRGIYTEGKSYEPGDCVTWAGSEWHCNEVTATRPGAGGTAWTLKVKRGRDGKDRL